MSDADDIRHAVARAREAFEALDQTIAELEQMVMPPEERERRDRMAAEFEDAIWGVDPDDGPTAEACAAVWRGMNIPRMADHITPVEQHRTIAELERENVVYRCPAAKCTLEHRGRMPICGSSFCPGRSRSGLSKFFSDPEEASRLIRARAAAGHMDALEFLGVTRDTAPACGNCGGKGDAHEPWCGRDEGDCP